MDELRAWITTWKCDVVAITETWLPQGQDWILQVPGFRRDREGGKRDGGVAVLIRDSVTAVEKMDANEGLSTESLCVEVRNRKGQ